MDPELRRIASRVVWWKAPEEVASNLDDFLCRVMTLGNLEDVNLIEARYGVDRLRAAIALAPAGVFDARSWAYWHNRLGLGEPGELPTRRFA